MRLTYAIKFVSDMDAAAAFYRDKLGLVPGFQSPFWSEFETGDTKLALHPASEQNPAGSVQLGFSTADIDGIYAAREGERHRLCNPADRRARNAHRTNRRSGSGRDLAER